MSSMRKKIPGTRPYRERHQPQERTKLGFLEKKKDYQKRSQDFNKKKATIKSLKSKAAEFNEDEFNYGMLTRQMSSKWSTGKTWSGTVHGDRGNEVLSMDTVRLLKTQDLGYLRTMRNIAQKDVKAREQRLAMAVALAGQDGNDDKGDPFDDEDDEEPTAGRGPTKIVFADDVDEREQAMRTRADEDDRDAPDRDDEDDEMQNDEPSGQEKVEILKRKLLNAKKRLRALAEAEEELQAQRSRMAKTPSYSGITKTGKKVKVRERKR
ncbi:U3 small nucleolar RNA-associated protein 11 [Thozetella sp. PMI_491]|nr:U3 small nucleolar RNA-associated protein 11 [Thozetella sp. PMI_491]